MVYQICLCFSLNEAIAAKVFYIVSNTSTLMGNELRKLWKGVCMVYMKALSVQFTCMD